MILPQIAAWLGRETVAREGEYVARAIDRYWSESSMELGVHLVALSARR
jgi:hypothetical protein